MEKRKRSLPLLTSSLVIVLSSAPDRVHGLGVEISYGSLFSLCFELYYFEFLMYFNK